MHATPDLLTERWPPPAAFADLRHSGQFTQGERAHFFVEFEVIQDIQVPAVGISLLSESGRVIRGKNTFQYPAPVPNSVRGSLV